MRTVPAVLVAGETLVDFLPTQRGPLDDVDQFDRRPGGAPANVAVGLARLGSPPLFWTRVGDDPFGRFLATTLTNHGLPNRYIEFDPDAKTTLAFVTHDDAGDRKFTFYRDEAADTRFEPGRIDDETLAALEWVHVGGVTLSSEPARSATLDLIERAASAGCTVSFDPNARLELWESPETFRRICREALAATDVCKATAGELELLGFDGETPAALGKDVLAQTAGPKIVFVTRGSGGAVAVVSSGEEADGAGLDELPWLETDTDRESGLAPLVVENAGVEVDTVDTTGAGDAFTAGAISALRDGDSVTETLEFACSVAAITTAGRGAMTAMPDREVIIRFREERSNSD
ncbi:PfkB domain-containing protein [Natrialba chahannaoensis JCM 10990]|uniref:PfkB domain-containing protein n=1 Tax=Natrialba chahannaoensis JCM 10990 TaxID=1227492 RepID=M0ANQ9_9EURY|nr:carbohydrate kinase [Natrialba chahannaoensis]ELY98993.1 PfkB domain-containing protein [Natrialba chahannaoensis JCM 10990]